MSATGNPYNKTFWEDEFYDPQTNEVFEEGTLFTADRANNIEDGIYNAYERILDGERRQKRVEVRLALLDRSSSSNVFYDTLDGAAPSKMKFDAARADIIEATVAAATVLKVSTVEGFKALTEVTIYDDVNHENVLIASIDSPGKTITVQALTNAYKKGAQICRSNVALDSVAKEMKIGDWGTYSIAVSEVV